MNPLDDYDTDDLIIGTCAACGDPIYEDEDYYQIVYEKSMWIASTSGQSSTE